MLKAKKAKNLKTLIRIAEQLSERKSDGHLTIMRFSTHWKVMLETPDLDCSKGRDEVLKLKGFDTLEDALADLITGHNRQYNCP